MAMNSILEADINGFEAYGNMDDYQRTSSASAFYPGQGTPLGLAYCALKLNGEAGELAEHVGKAMRDDRLMPIFEHSGECSNDTDYVSLSRKLTPERRELILKEIGDCLWYLGALCRELGTSLSVVAAMNLRKLYSRQQRDVLSGSGDER